LIPTIFQCADFFRFYYNFRFHVDVISVRTGRVLNRDDCADYSNDLVEGDYRQWFKEFLIEEPFQRYNVAR
jgi:hypothetical protein